MKTNILKQHGIKVVELPNGIVLADNEDGTFKNVTDLSIEELYNYLGY